MGVIYFRKFISLKSTALIFNFSFNNSYFVLYSCKLIMSKSSIKITHGINSDKSKRERVESNNSIADLAKPKPKVQRTTLKFTSEVYNTPTSSKTANQSVKPMKKAQNSISDAVTPKSPMPISSNNQFKPSLKKAVERTPNKQTSSTNQSISKNSNNSNSKSSASTSSSKTSVCNEAAKTPQRLKSSNANSVSKKPTAATSLNTNNNPTKPSSKPSDDNYALIKYTETNEFEVVHTKRILNGNNPIVVNRTYRVLYNNIEYDAKVLTLGNLFSSPFKINFFLS